jgi:hypothetical protein
VHELEHEKRNIEQYVLSQDHGAEVTLVQRITSTKVMGKEHEIWDVHTTSGTRYWVITNGTNLYDQAKFPDYDETLSFHVGLMIRVMEKSRVEMPDDAHGHVDISWRKYEQAVDAFNVADEAEAFQAVGIHCREALIALGRELARVVPEDVPQPKGSDFKGWAEGASEAIAEGRIRSYLKQLADTTWNLATWLEHYDRATNWDADLVLDATAHLIGAFGVAIHRHEAGEPPRCPRCNSYRVDYDYDYHPETDISAENKVCGACEHQWDFNRKRMVEGEGWVDV